MSIKKDYLDGDHSFRNWFKIMWGNGYIFLFLVGFSLMITQVVAWKEVVELVKDNYANGVGTAIMITVAMLLPLAMTAVIGYKGLYQFWNDLKNGRSR